MSLSQLKLWVPLFLLMLTMSGCPSNNNPGDEDPDDGLPCEDPTYTAADPCCSVIPAVPEAEQCGNQDAFEAVCAEDDFCCLEEWESCCVAMYVDDHGANCL